MLSFTGIVLLLSLFSTIQGLRNGLSLTPPMGWLHWQRFRCNLDCETFPNECISEKLFMDMADRMAEDGYLEAGYEFVIMDDCWLANDRDQNGKLQPDPNRFPSGIKALADYVHSKGLKFGLYEDIGDLTCAGYPGSYGNLKLHADTFAEWGVDYLKMDGCNLRELSEMEERYYEMSVYLNKTGRPIVFSCEAPLYLGLDKTNFTMAVESCNLFRIGGDINDDWESVKQIVDSVVTNQDYLIEYSGPGHWNDPDMLIIGDFGLSYDQSVAQMTMWAMMASPLIMSNDLRNIRPEMKEILQHRGAIAINQDSLGIQGHRHETVDGINPWMRQINPTVGDYLSYALAFVSYRTDGTPYGIRYTLAQYGLNNPKGYTMQNIWDDLVEDVVVLPDDNLTAWVNPTGALLYKLIATE